jgi:hypothetical protein
MFALSEFDIRYQPAKAVKGQALADLIAERINTDIADQYFDRSACGDGCGIGILLVSPQGAAYSFSIRLPTPYTNNLAEYEVVRKGMWLERKQIEPIFRYTCWNKETGEPISSIT